MKFAYFFQIHNLICAYRSKLNLINITPSQSRVMVAKNFIPLAIVTNGYEGLNFHDFPNKYGISLKVSQKS